MQMQKWAHDAVQSRWRTIKLARTRWAEVDGDQRAAAFAYYLLLSLLPLIVLLVTAGSLFVEREVATQEVVQLVNHYIPLTGEQERAAVATIRGLLEARGKINLAAFPLLVWGALKFLRTLIRTTNRIWHSPTYNWWRLPLKSLGLLGITASAVLIGILLPGVARLVRRWLISYLEFPKWAFALMFQSYSVARAVLRVHHDLQTGPESAHQIFRSLARRAGRDGLDLDWANCCSWLTRPTSRASTRSTAPSAASWRSCCGFISPAAWACSASAFARRRRKSGGSQHLRQTNTAHDELWNGEHPCKGLAWQCAAIGRRLL